MPDRPTDTPAGSTADPAEQPSRSLSVILEELAQLSHAQQGEASEMRSAVSELSRALARLFEMIRTDRHEQRARIAQLERELAAARDQLAALGADPVVPPAPNDFDQLRAAAERLRIRTEQLVRESASAEAAAEDVVDGPLAVDAVVTDELAAGQPPAGDPATGPNAGDPAGAPVEPTPQPVLRVIEGAAPLTPERLDLDVESDLPLAHADVAQAPIPEPPRAPAPEPEEREQIEDPAARAAADERDAPSSDVVEAPIEPAPDASVEGQSPPEPARPSRPEPIAIPPRPERKRGLRPRRRRIDARKLSDIEPAAALGSMVSAIDPLWTAGCSIDLVVAFTDGGAVRVAGGDRQPLRVEEVEPGTPARSTITATRRQLVPLFGRLALTDEESAPLIHGSRRDADLLVGWFDRAQRLPVEPL